MSIRIEEWSVVKPGDPYRAPETLPSCLSGRVFGHPRFDDGHRVTTSSVKETSGRTVWTSSGSIYELGEPDPQYLDYLEENGLEYDPVQPVFIKR